MSKIQRSARLAADYVLCDVCVLCRLPLAPRPWRALLRINDHLCPYCRTAVALNTQCCQHCALPIPAGQHICGRCVSEPVADLTLAPVLHQHCGAYLVHQWKFHRGEREALALAGFLLAAVRQRYPDSEPIPELLIPVPIAPWTQLRRGYNQSHWLAQTLHKQLNIPVAANLLTRKSGPSQRAQTRSQRVRLTSNTFQLKPDAEPEPLQNRHVAIVDDVLTTGTTVSVIAKTLRQAGAKRVDTWCATRA